MGDLCADKPKCMSELKKGFCIIDLQIQTFLELGMNDFLITTGPYADKLKDYLYKKYPTLKVEYVHNPIYDKTNYIYSLHLARKSLNTDIILLHGDMVIDTAIAQRLLDSKEKNLVIMDNNSPLPQKDFKGRMKNNFLEEISIHLSGEEVFFLLPFYKISIQELNYWMDEILSFVNENNTGVYAEEAFNKISEKMKLKALWLKNELCMEVDTPEDLQEAQKQMEERS